MNSDITLIIPLYNEAKDIEQNFSAIHSICKECPASFTYLLVDDGSTDTTRSVLAKMRKNNSSINYLSFTRNFGKEAAIEAGLSHAKGRACIVMDADLQHPPKLIPQMLRLWQDGSLIVDAVKSNRGDGWLRSLFSNMFYSLLRKTAGIDLKGHSDFKLLDRKVVDFFLQLHERHKFFRGVIAWSGFPSNEIAFDVQPRSGGDSKWSSLKLLRYAFVNIASFTYVPMMALGWMGLLTASISLIVGIISLIRWMLGDALPGFTTIILLITFLGGVLLLGIGVVAYYVSLLIDEARDRPRYVVEVSEE